MIRIICLMALLAVPAAAEQVPVSGYAFLLPETRALQDDDFANPGMLWVDRGGTLWDAAPAGGRACASCHGEAEVSMRGIGTSYPAYSETEGRVTTLEQRINLCRTDQQGAPALEWDSGDLLALTAFVMRQSHGLPIAVATDGPAAEALARGQTYYQTRRGQLDLSCADCHVANEGRHLRGELISQGQVNGFPIYRQLWQDMGSLSRMIAWCNDAVRADPLRPGSPEIVDLELYLFTRANGLLLETPAVRR